MNELYSLSIYCMNGTYKEVFFIGIFSSADKAKATAEKYLREVSGFCDYPCTVEIQPKKVIGDTSSLKTVSMIQGWDEDENCDEINIWESDLYSSYKQALEELVVVQLKMNCKEWVCNIHEIDKNNWSEGFIRVY